MKDITAHQKKQEGTTVDFLEYGDTFRYEASKIEYEYMVISLLCSGLDVKYPHNHRAVVNLKSGTIRLLPRDCRVKPTRAKLETWLAEERQ